ncbi:MAG: ATP-dependent DNA helicase, partial [Coriobacteriales bacterium]|nr:ATP-dependent DNA helicase [Coriobacteriales bacterium]
PALKAMASGKLARVAFLTAKTTTRGPVLECLDLLRQQDFRANVLVMTARDKICPLRAGAQSTAVRARPLSSLCNPVECPRARGHYDAVNDALYEAITTYDVLDAARVEAVAARHHVCPYELQRDAARWFDVMVCDYHYAFAPSASLAGLSDEPGDGDAVYLVDEAHNLVERMREMYSAELCMADLKELERLLRANGNLDELATSAHAVVAAFPAWDKTLPTGMGPRSGRRKSKKPGYQVARLSDVFTEALTTLANGIDATLEQLLSAMEGARGNENHAQTPGASAIEVFLAVRDADYCVGAFLSTLQRAEAGYVTFLSQAEHGNRALKIYCMDPSHDLAERLEKAKAAVFFSGTLLPMDYHRKLLAAQTDDASIYATSNFDPHHLQVLIGSDVSTRYAKRGPALYARCASYLLAVAHARPGNYLAFLPSYAMLEEVAKVVAPLVDDKIEVMRQRPRMREGEREQFIDRFRRRRGTGTSLIGLCVLGGVFGESIDLPGEALVGVVVIGTGMPRASAEREVIRDYFDAKEGKGFAYAYTYPGMIKVLQAAGRLIRTEKDRGVVVLLDDRFLEDELQKAFPKEWKNVRTCTLDTVPKLLAPLV